MSVLSFGSDPNLVISAMVKAWIASNPWAYERDVRERGSFRNHHGDRVARVGQMGGS
jgi:hypothetical protein